MAGFMENILILKNRLCIGRQLAIKAATDAVSVLGAGAGAAVSGISGIAGVAAKTGVSVATGVTSTVATNAIQYAGDWDKFSDSMSSFSTWSGVVTSAAGSLVTNSLNEVVVGARYETALGEGGRKITRLTQSKLDGFNSNQIGSIQNLNGTIGGLASAGLSYGLTGEATFNILNISDFGAGASSGLLEMTLSKDRGVAARLGTGGTDLSFGTVASSLQGIKTLNKNLQITRAANRNNMANAATALRTQYGFGDEKQLAQLEEILKGRTELKRGNGDGKAQTVTENGKRTVYLNSYKENMTREEQFALGITLGHEAYRDGITGGAQSQFNETAESVLGHTVMAKRIQSDSMYNDMMTGIINADMNLKNDMTVFDYAIAAGDWGAFGSYVGNTYDYSADYWRVLRNGDLYDDGLDDRVSFEDGSETIYYGKRSKQKTLEKYLDIESGKGYSILMKESGYSWNGKSWEIDEAKNPNKIISRKLIESQIKNGKVGNKSYYEPMNYFEKGVGFVKNTINSIVGSEKERERLLEKQKELIEDERYQQGSEGPNNYLGATSETTWCNKATEKITFETSYELSMALRNKGDKYWENTNANDMFDNLVKAAGNPNSHIIEITPEQAQNLANKGYTVVGSWKNDKPNQSGHIATVEPGYEYEPDRGPYFGNVGTRKYSGFGKTALEAFGSDKLDKIKYFYYDNQFNNRR